MVELALFGEGTQIVSEIDRRKSSVDILEHVAQGVQAPTERDVPATAHDRGHVKRSPARRRRAPSRLRRSKASR